MAHASRRVLSLVTHADAVEPYLQALTALRSAPKLFARGNSAEKRSLLQQLTCNLTLAGRSLAIEAKKPFALLGEWSRCPCWSAYRDQVETHVSDQGAIVAR